MENSTTLTMRKLFACLLFPFFFLSCNKENSPDLFKTTGVMQTVWRSPGKFHHVYLDYRTHLLIKQDSAQEISVRAGKNLLPRIETSIRNDTLFIHNNNRFNFVRNFRDSVIVSLFVPTLRSITYKSSGSVQTIGQLNMPSFDLTCRDGSGQINLNLHTDSLSLYFHTGPADMRLDGSTDYLYLYSAGQGFIQLQNCVANLAQVDSRGSGDCFVHASTRLLADINGAGNVNYVGNPGILVKGAGPGRLIPYR
jgi:hypothetical protein